MHVIEISVVQEDLTPMLFYLGNETGLTNEIERRFLCLSQTSYASIRRREINNCYEESEESFCKLQIFKQNCVLRGYVDENDIKDPRSHSS